MIRDQLFEINASLQEIRLEQRNSTDEEFSILIERFSNLIQEYFPIYQVQVFPEERSGNGVSQIERKASDCIDDFIYRAFWLSNEKKTNAAGIINSKIQEALRTNLPTESLELCKFILEWGVATIENKINLIENLSHLCQKYPINPYFMTYRSYLTSISGEIDEKYLATKQLIDNFDFFKFTIEDHTGYSYSGNVDAAKSHIVSNVLDCIEHDLNNNNTQRALERLNDEKFRCINRHGWIDENGHFNLKRAEINSYLRFSEKYKDLEVDLKSKFEKKLEENRKKTVEMLGVFSAVIAFIVAAATQLGANANKEISVPILITIGLILVLFVSTISLFNDKPEKDKFFSDYRSWILIAYLFFSLALAVFTKFFFE